MVPSPFPAKALLQTGKYRRIQCDLTGKFSFFCCQFCQFTDLSFQIPSFLCNIITLLVCTDPVQTFQLSGCIKLTAQALRTMTANATRLAHTGPKGKPASVIFS